MPPLSDIKNQVASDAGALSTALMSGSIKAGEKALSTFLNEDEVELLVLRIIEFAITEKLLTICIQALGSMKWMSMTEACLYSRKSPNTLKGWVNDGKIYASPPDVSGEWVFDRESIDSFLYGPRDKRRLELKRRRVTT